MAERKTSLADFDFGRVDLSTCDREQIHLPGSIQPHGFLLVLDPGTLAIRQLSTNVADLIGCDPEALLGGSMRALLDDPSVDRLRAVATEPDLEVFSPLPLNLRPDLLDKDGGALSLLAYQAASLGERFETRFAGMLHRNEAGLILEIGIESQPSEPVGTVNTSLRRAIARLGRTQTTQELLQVAVAEMRALSGYDRVMLYQFDPDWNGQVKAEAKVPQLGSYLGLHFPATDIPQQARRLYVMNPVRTLGWVDYRPVPVVPAVSPATGTPLDFSHSVLRSVSPIHLEYLRNMGVQATMSVSILRDGRLWGLLACHHMSPHVLSHERRQACALLGEVIGLQLALKQDQSMIAYEARYRSVIARMVENAIQSDDIASALHARRPNVLDLVEAGGAALYYEDGVVTLGVTPPKASVRRLLKWLAAQRSHFSSFFTTNLGALHEEARGYTGVGSGLLAVSLTGNWQNAILWFRPEVTHTVKWGGKPHKGLEADEHGEMRLRPRKSFEAWSELVRGQAVPWTTAEVEAVGDLRRAIIDIALRRAEELEALNRELRRSNDELDSFSYIASHDLKEPLRGIQNYSRFLLEDYGERLDEEGRRQLETIGHLSERLNDFITALLQYSRVGRVDLAAQIVDLNQVVKDALTLLQVPIEERQAVVRVARPLPKLRCDRVRIGEVFSNLISNAIKYNTADVPEVEIGHIPPDRLAEAPESVRRQATSGHHTFYVRDNGIGIRERHQQAIFRIFKRLHGRSKYGGGTGAGLTIVERIVQRHQGTIWVESELGEGATFYFTLVTDLD
ncbi:MAG: ATP-binding protein [Bacteroidota bacterium]